MTELIADPQRLATFCGGVLRSLGMLRNDAALVADSLVQSEL
jgi:LDH2 family malate/lactate/ureidoglycolate dehydrogenase